MLRFILILTASLLLNTLSLANLDPDKAGRPPHGNVTSALARAEALYQGGQLTEALRWIERAHKLLAFEIELDGDPGIRQLSNARQLLKYLDIYDDFAYGLDQELDEAHDFLVDHLEAIVAIETGGRYAASLVGLDFSTWPNGQVHRIRGIDVGHWADGRIHRVGSYHIRYWANGVPHNIGGIDYGYRFDSRWPDRVGSVFID